MAKILRLICLFTPARNPATKGMTVVLTATTVMVYWHRGPRGDDTISYTIGPMCALLVFAYDY